MATDNFKPLQAQSFSLAGGGAVAGATSIILKSFTQIDGTNITMSNLGTKAYMTLEPGNGSLEEQISFTGVTQNTNGTATLTGVSTVLFADPYTETSGLAKTHAGSTTAVLSNTSGFYNQILSKNDDATITGKYTFPGGGTTNAPVSGTVYSAPTADLELASKKYVDSVAVSGAPDGNTTTKGIVQEATADQIIAQTDTGSTGAHLFVNPSMFPFAQMPIWVSDTGGGGTNHYVVNPTSPYSAYADGMMIYFRAQSTNTGACDINVSSLGTKPISLDLAGTALPAGTIQSGFTYLIYYSTSRFLLLNVTTQNIIPSGTIQMFGGTSAPTGWLLCNGSAVSRVGNNAALFAAIGTAFGVGDGSTTFNLPDLRGRVGVGKNSATFGTLGATGGEETHTLTTPEIPSHSHLLPNFWTNTTGGGGIASVAYTSGSLSGELSTANTGGDGAHNNIQPYQVVNYIIKL